MEKCEIGNWNDMTFQPGRKGAKRALFGTDLKKLSCMINEIRFGHDVVSGHLHPDEQMSIILQGTCDYFVDGEPHEMTPGSWIAVGSNVEHHIVVTSETEPVMILDIFSPARPGLIDAYKKFLESNK